MLTIAQCTDSFLPASDGVGRVSYARVLAENGHDVFAVTPINRAYKRYHARLKVGSVSPDIFIKVEV